MMSILERSWLEKKNDRLTAAFVFIILAVVYWHNRCSSFGPGDSPQHVLSSIVWGVSVAPGYPLYVMVGHLMSRLPFGTPAANVNGLSGLCHALAAALFYLTLRRQGAKPAAALLAVALMGLSRLFWYYSEIAEVRALNDLLALSAAYWAAVWIQEKKPSALWALAASIGLGLSHHPTYVLILPALACWLWISAALPRRRALPFAAILLASCAFPYLILWLRLQWSGPAYNPDETRTLLQVWRLFTRQSVGGPLRMVVGTGVFGFAGFDAKSFLQHLAWFLAASWTDLLPTGLFLVAAGSLKLWKTNRRMLIFWALWTCASALCFIAISSQQLILCDAEYVRGMVARFYLLPFIGAFALTAFGAQWLFDRVRPAFVWALMAGSLATPLWLRPMNLEAHNPLMDYSRLMIQSSGPSDFVVLSPDDTILSLTYLQLVERATADRVLLVPSLFGYPPYIRSLKRLHPGLNLPPLTGKGELTTDWMKWLSLNPRRSLFAEGVLRDTILERYPKSVPHGVLVRVSERGLPRKEIAAEARRFIDSPQRDSLTRWNLYDFTQEVYLLRPYAMMIEWYGTFLDPRDQARALRIRNLLSGL